MRPRGSDFVGRAEELARIQRCFARASAGQPSIALVGGEAGIGKTRLVRESAAALDGDPIVLAGGCVHLGGPGFAFAPLIAALRDLEAQVGESAREGVETRLVGNAEDGSAALSHRQIHRGNSL